MKNGYGDMAKKSPKSSDSKNGLKIHLRRAREPPRVVEQVTYGLYSVGVFSCVDIGRFVSSFSL